MFQVAAGVWALVILTATSVPGLSVSTSAPDWADKVVHFMLYCVLGVLTTRAFLSTPPDGAAAAAGARRGIQRHAGWLAVALLAIFAGADEVHQHWIRGRTPSVADWLADVAGAGFGLAIGMHMRRSNRTPVPGVDRETNR
jgi:VanZ family protein